MKILPVNPVKIGGLVLLGDGLRRLFADNIAKDNAAETGFFSWLKPNRTDDQKKVGYGLALAEMALGLTVLIWKKG